MLDFSGGEFVVYELAKLRDGVCPTCLSRLPPFQERVREFTCNDECHQKWINEIIFRLGKVRHITLLTTGKIYAVPTRVILEEGITGAALSKYPEVKRV